MDIYNIIILVSVIINILFNISCIYYLYLLNTTHKMNTHNIFSTNFKQEQQIKRIYHEIDDIKEKIYNNSNVININSLKNKKKYQKEIKDPSL